MLEYKLQKDHCLYFGFTTPFPVISEDVSFVKLLFTAFIKSFQ